MNHLPISYLNVEVVITLPNNLMNLEGGPKGVLRGISNIFGYIFIYIYIYIYIYTLHRKLESVLCFPIHGKIIDIKNQSPTVAIGAKKYTIIKKKIETDKQAAKRTDKMTIRLTNKQKERRKDRRKKMLEILFF